MLSAICSDDDHIYAINFFQEIAKREKRVVYGILRCGFYWLTFDFDPNWVIKAYPGGRTEAKLNKS